jgi:hypothetical protein
LCYRSTRDLGVDEASKARDLNGVLTAASNAIGSPPVSELAIFDLPPEVLTDQRALRRLALADLRGMDAAGVLSFKARLARRSAASRLSSACSVETIAICAARRSAELGRRVVGCTVTVTFCLTAIAISLFDLTDTAVHGIRGLARDLLDLCVGLLAPAA